METMLIFIYCMLATGLSTTVISGCSKLIFMISLALVHALNLSDLYVLCLTSYYEIAVIIRLVSIWLSINFGIYLSSSMASLALSHVHYHYYYSNAWKPTYCY